MTTTTTPRFSKNPGSDTLTAGLAPNHTMTKTREQGRGWLFECTCGYRQYAQSNEPATLHAEQLMAEEHFQVRAREVSRLIRPEADQIAEMVTRYAPKRYDTQFERKGSPRRSVDPLTELGEQVGAGSTLSSYDLLRALSWADGAFKMAAEMHVADQVRELAAAGKDARFVAVWLADRLMRETSSLQSRSSGQLSNIAQDHTVAALSRWAERMRDLADTIAALSGQLEEMAAQHTPGQWAMIMERAKQLNEERQEAMKALEQA